MENSKQVRHFSIGYALFALFVIAISQTFLAQQNQTRHIPYSEFIALLKNGHISEVSLTESSATGTLTKSDSDGKKRVHTNRVEHTTAQTFLDYGVKFSKQKENTFVRDIFSWVAPLFIFLLIWAFLAKKIKGGMQGGFMAVGKSKAKIYVETNTKVTFAEVAGAEEAKSELKELVDFLKQPDRFKRLGTRMPKGVLLVGPPGTGKTLIAKAVAGEASVPFFSTNGAEFVEMFVGVGAARVRDLFEQAKKKSPCIIFVDEIDALGKVRMPGGMSHGNDEKEQTLNQLLAELDGFDSLSGIILLAATNRPEVLDPALLRSGRFDRQVLVDRPDKIGRQAILKLHSKKTKLADDLDFEKISALTSGFTGADIENLVNEASLIATRRDGKDVCEQDFVMGMERLVAGLEKKNRFINDFERSVVAHHEMGHAIVAHSVSQSEAVQKVSIIPRGVGALGYTLQRPTEDRYLMTKMELLNKVATLMGGRAAEQLIFRHSSTGAADDLAKATDIVRSIVARYGMSEKLGDAVFEQESGTILGGPAGRVGPSRAYSDETAREIDCCVREMLKESRERAEAILSRNIDLLRESAKSLIAKETLSESDLLGVFAKIKKEDSV